MAYLSKSGRLYRLSEPNGDATKPSFDIIALHGISGSWDSTWTASDGYCWLSAALPLLYPSSRVVSIDLPSLLQDLSCNPVNVDSLILDLIQERASCGRSNHPIIFIGHSFGGVLLKEIFVATHPSSCSRSEFHDLHHSIRSYVYLGTPHKNLEFPDVSKLWRALASGDRVPSRSSTLQQALQSVSKTNYEFRRLGGEDVTSICFYETIHSYIGLQQRLVINKEEATISSMTLKVVPLDAEHQFLGSFSYDQNSNFARLLGSFQRLMTIAEEPLVRRQVTRNRRLRLLSLDGGGVKGLFSILVLQRLLEEVQRLEGQTAGRKRACDYFDLIGGTSTGGLLAIMLGRLQMDTPSCIRTYRSLAKKIFWRNPWVQAIQPFSAVASAVLNTSWYSGSTLKQCICSTIKDYLPMAERDQLTSVGHGVEDARLVSNIPAAPRCFVCAVPSGQHKVERIRSYRSIDPRSRDTSSYKIWEAACATSAAPMYFPKVQIGDRYYFDGGLESNNPVIEIIEEARREFPGADIDAVVSIGTGRANLSDPSGTINTLMHFIQRATDTEVHHQRVLEEDAFRDILPGYYRLRGETSLGDIDLAGFDKLGRIEQLADDYLNSIEGKNMISACAVRLARREE